MKISLLILGVVILLFTLLFGLIFIYFRNANQKVNRARRKQNRISLLQTKQSNRSSNRLARPSYDSHDSEIRIEQLSQQLQNKILLLLNGDRNTANRLLNLAKTRNPQKSVQWCVEKVILDLQRDRGGY